MPPRLRLMAEFTQELQRDHCLDAAEKDYLLELLQTHMINVELVQALLKRHMKKKHESSGDERWVRYEEVLRREVLRMRMFSVREISKIGLTNAPRVGRRFMGSRPLINDWRDVGTGKLRFTMSQMHRMVDLLCPPADNAPNRPPNTFVAYSHRINRETALMIFLHKLAIGGDNTTRLMLFGGTDTKNSAVYEFMISYIYTEKAHNLEDVADILRFDLQEIHDSFVDRFDKLGEAHGVTYEDSRLSRGRTAIVAANDGTPSRTPRPNDPEVENAAYSHHRHGHGFNVQCFRLFNALVGAVHVELMSQNDARSAHNWNLEVRV